MLTNTKVGHMLGDLADEYPEYSIREYVLGENKQYELKIVHRETGAENKFSKSEKGLVQNETKHGQTHPIKPQIWKSETIVLAVR